jgi:hypothetical protein
MFFSLWQIAANFKTKPRQKQARRTFSDGLSAIY